MLFFIASFVSAAQASSFFNFLLSGGGSNTNNTVTGGNATNNTDSLMKQMGMGSVVAFSANTQYGIYAVQSDNKLFYKKDLNAPVEQVNPPSFQGKITQLLDLKIAVMALTDGNRAYFCMHPCNVMSNWNLVGVDTNKYKMQTLLQLGRNLGILTDNNMLVIKTPDDTVIPEQPSQGIKHAHALPGSDYQAYVDKDGKLVLINSKNGAFKQNFLGEGYSTVLLTDTYLYGVRGQMVTRCKLPCEGNDANMVDYMAGKDTILMAAYNKNILACNKGAPLIAVAEDN